MPSNLPPGAGGVSYRTHEVRCPNGHVWEVEMAEELGGAFPLNDDDMVCPECGETEEDS